jgi:hypothetical protein
MGRCWLLAIAAFTLEQPQRYKVSIALRNYRPSHPAAWQRQGQRSHRRHREHPNSNPREETHAAQAQVGSTRAAMGVGSASDVDT